MCGARCDRPCTIRELGAWTSCRICEALWVRTFKAGAWPGSSPAYMISLECRWTPSSIESSSVLRFPGVGRICRFDVEYRPSSEDQRILVQAVDEVPAGFQLEIGIRVPEGAMVESIWLNDQECAPMGWRLQPMPAEAPQEAWMSTDFKSRTEVEFRFKRP